MSAGVVIALTLYTLLLFVGKLCSSEGQSYVNEEEGLDGAGLDAENEQVTGSQVYFRGARNSQVSPEGSLCCIFIQ